MIKDLSVQNFALITKLQVTFAKGLSTITGETGAGKSLLLGALGLLTGKRADTSVMRDTDKKCIIEANFDLAAYDLASFFEDNDLDFETITCIRREILPSGKSRAFVNDTPVNLNALQALGKRLVDIHSQHQTLELTQSDFQFYILDALAQTKVELASFARGLVQLKKAENTLEELQQNEAKFKEAYDYNSFLLKELQEANILENEQPELESDLEKLSNTEEIQERLNLALACIVTENQGAHDQLSVAKLQLQKVSSFSNAFEELANRMASVHIELDDLRSAIESEAELIQANPQRLTEVNERLQLLYSLQKKHLAANNIELLSIQEKLTDQVSATENMQEAISEAEKDINLIQEKLTKLADKIHAKRKKILPHLVEELEKILESLGMPNARLKPELERTTNFTKHGGDDFNLLFSANKGGQFGTLKKVASGGELSRIMLAVKMILAAHIQLPTIIFDEIDTGVSGEVAQQMADLLQRMSTNQQVFSITHLPQIAAKGAIHYKVYKEDVNNVTQTNLKALNQDERINEIAEMIGGKQLSAAAKTHAEALLAN